MTETRAGRLADYLQSYVDAGGIRSGSMRLFISDQLGAIDAPGLVKNSYRARRHRLGSTNSRSVHNNSQQLPWGSKRQTEPATGRRYLAVLGTTERPTEFQEDADAH
jgi:hypothetical protein